MGHSDGGTLQMAPQGSVDPAEARDLAPSLGADVMPHFGALPARPSFHHRTGNL